MAALELVGEVNHETPNKLLVFVATAQKSALSVGNKSRMVALLQCVVDLGGNYPYLCYINRSP